MAGGKYLKAEIVRKKGKNMLNDPIFNKGLAFPRAERDRLDIRGKSSHFEFSSDFFLTQSDKLPY
jgi:hypothetical protein